MEVKIGRATLRPAQAVERDAILAAGGLYVLAHTVDDLEAGAARCRPRDQQGADVRERIMPFGTVWATGKLRPAQKGLAEAVAEVGLELPVLR